MEEQHNMFVNVRVKSVESFKKLAEILLLKDMSFANGLLFFWPGSQVLEPEPYYSGLVW